MRPSTPELPERMDAGAVPRPAGPLEPSGPARSVGSGTGDSGTADSGTAGPGTAGPGTASPASASGGGTDSRGTGPSTSNSSTAGPGRTGSATTFPGSTGPGLGAAGPRAAGTGTASPRAAGPGSARPPQDGRDESELERLDRNWSALLQELRVLQTGTQLLTGFLLTIVFQPVFGYLATWQKGLYLLVVSLSTFSTVLVLMPVSLHRLLFRRSAMRELVAWGDRMLRGGLIVTGLAIVGVISLVFGVALGVAAAIVGAVVAAAAVGGLWLALPVHLRRRLPPPHP